MIKNKQQIKIITYSNFPFGGAAANFVRNMAIGLVENGGCVEVVLPTGHYFGKNIDVGKSKSGEVEGVLYRHFGYKVHPKAIVGKVIDNLFGSLFSLSYIIKSKWLGEIDVLIKYGVSFSSNLFLTVLCKLLRIKFVNVIPEFYEKPKSSESVVSMVKWYNFYIGLSKVCGFTDGVIVLSDFLKNYILKQYNYEKPIIIIPNFINRGSFSEYKSTNNNENLIIGYTGTPTKKDGILDLLESFALVNQDHPTAQLLIIGDIRNGKSVIPDLKEYARKLNIDEHIKFTGLVQFSEIPSLLHSCDILVLARPNGVSAEAGFPTKLGEYFACKKPVVVTSVGDIKKYFEKTNIVQLVEPGNYSSIANGISGLIVDKKKRDFMAEAGYIWMLENLDYKKLSKRVMDFLVEL